VRWANNTVSTSVNSVTVIAENWAPVTRCMIGTAASPKCPMPKNGCGERASYCKSRLTTRGQPQQKGDNEHTRAI
jgi:hypothetical protein